MINLFQVTNGELEECEEQKLAVYEKLKVDFFSSEIQNKLWIENTHNRTIQQGPLWMLVNETIFTPSLERFEIEIIVITVNIIAIIIIMIKSTLF